MTITCKYLPVLSHLDVVSYLTWWKTTPHHQTLSTVGELLRVPEMGTATPHGDLYISFSNFVSYNSVGRLRKIWRKPYFQIVK